MLTGSSVKNYYLCMVGKIRTKEHCPKCKGKFKGEPLRCPDCQITPRRFYLDLPWHGQKIKLYSDQDGYPLESYGHAYRLLEHVRLEVDRGIFDPKNYVKRDLRELQFSTYFESWLARRRLEQERGHLSLSYLRSVKVYGKGYLIPFFQDKNIRDITAGNLEDFSNSLPPKLAAKTVHNILGILHKIFTDALRRQDIKTIPTFPHIEVPENKIKWITKNEQEEILKQVRCPVRRVFYLFLMRTGCRPGEARALKWEDVDLKQGVVTIHAAMDEETLRPYTKERDVRVLPLHPELLEGLRTLPRSLSGIVFTLTGRPLRANLIWETWRVAARRAGIDISCYQGTKHSLGCQLLNSGVREEVLQAIFGHKDRSSTKRYAKLVSDSLKYWESD